MPPSTNSLLNDLRSIQFPPPGAGASQGGATGFGGGAFGQVGGSTFGGGAFGQLGGSGGGAFAAGGPALGAEAGASAPDFACVASPNAAAWAAVKQIFRKGVADKPLQPVGQEGLAAVLEGTLREMKAANLIRKDAPDECGLGKLCLQLLSLVMADEAMAMPQIFAGLEQLASPVLTALLDVPWAALAVTGWPVLALLDQINLKKQAAGALNPEGVDGLEQPNAQLLLGNLAQALPTGDVAAIGQAAGTYLAYHQQQNQMPQSSPLSLLTALAAQAASARPQERVEVLEALQNAMKQVIGSPAELDVALSTRWPLWGLVHASVDSLAG